VLVVSLGAVLVEIGEAVVHIPVDRRRLRACLDTTEGQTLGGK